MKRQASISNDQVFPGQMLKRENKEPNVPPKFPTKSPTIGATDLETKPPASGAKSGGVCKCNRHKLQHCPLIKKSKHVAVRRQYAAFCGFCFKFALKGLGMVADRMFKMPRESP